MSIDTIIEEENVNLATLAVELERATIANQTRGDQSLYVSEPGMFPFWVEIREGIRCILLHSYLEFVPDCEHTLPSWNTCPSGWATSCSSSVSRTLTEKFRDLAIRRDSSPQPGMPTVGPASCR